jgi:hypothetical protein
MKRPHLSTVVFFLAMMTLLFSATASAAEKPNILVIWGDDIGQSNISTSVLTPGAWLVTKPPISIA